MVRALVLAAEDLPSWRQRHPHGDVPSALPYGLDVLEQQGWSFEQRYHGLGRRAGRLRAIVEHRSGMPVERAVRSVPVALRSDLVLALLEHQAYFPGWLKGRGIPPYAGRPLVVWSCWLADDLLRADRERRQWLLRRVASADLITHLSRHETEIFVDLGIPEERLFPVTYGVSHRHYRPDPDRARDIELLAVGQDRGRDYGTLLEAVRGTTLTLDVVCKPENLAGLDIPDNVRVHTPVTLPTYRELLQRARVVAVPTMDLAYPTGSSVALEAASSGCAVAVTGTRAMRDYFVHDVSAALVEVGDVDGWRATLTKLSTDEELVARLGAGARRSVVERFNADHMWTELAEVLRIRGLVP